MNKQDRSANQSVLSRHLLHQNVQDRCGQRLGQLTDLLVNAGTGRVEFGRLSVVDEGAPDKYVLDIPWSQFRYHSGRLELDVSRKVLRRVARSRTLPDS